MAVWFLKFITAITFVVTAITTKTFFLPVFV